MALQGKKSGRYGEISTDSKGQPVTQKVNYSRTIRLKNYLVSMEMPLYLCQKSVHEGLGLHIGATLFSDSLLSH